MSSEDAIVTFTARSPGRIVREGGSQAWVLNPDRARQCTWLVCTQNGHNRDHQFSDATERHGSAFLVGRISEIRQADGEGDDEDRWMIAIDEYALVEIPDMWGGSRNPVRYSSLAELGIDADALEFVSMPEQRESLPTLPPASLSDFNVEDTKRALAAHFGVKPGAIEITIRV